MKRPSRSKTTPKRKKTPSKSPAAKTPPSRQPAKLATAKRGRKHDAILALLRKPEGVTIASLVEAIEWQPHSVRGFLAGTVRKKLGLKLTSNKVDGVRRYRIES